MLRIQGLQNSAEVEKLLWLVAQNDGLQLPLRPKGWWLGGEQSLIELVITWARVRPLPHLLTHIRRDENPTAQLRSMARRMFGFVALLMADEILDLTADAERSLRAPAYEQCQEIVEMMFKPTEDFALGSKAFLICVDHSTRWNIPWLYSPDRTVSDRVEFVTLAKVSIGASNDTTRGRFKRYHLTC